ncbi:hypothetical protein Pmani_019842 [Petrolisthes manimaculis]|uniref:Transmembrane protein n=1 Tax=Petrolisthes manimaculis TaxID=1843537 RepID=A0AAE1U3M7_9EUCA|nr:hypothetical protein Pmani_019842 [Petrolisthes manimaculis]
MRYDSGLDRFPDNTNNQTNTIIELTALALISVVLIFSSTFSLNYLLHHFHYPLLHYHITFSTITTSTIPSSTITTSTISSSTITTIIIREPPHPTFPFHAYPFKGP